MAGVAVFNVGRTLIMVLTASPARPPIAPQQPLPPAASRQGLFHRPFAGLTILLLLACLAAFHGLRPNRVFVPPGVLSPDQSGMKQLAEQVSWTEYAAARWQKFQVPLWNPYDQTGVPLVGNGASAVFYPTMLLHMYFPPQLAWAAAAILKLFLAAAGVWLLSRRYGISPPGRVLAAAAFMLCAFNIGWIHDPRTNVMVLLPWAILVTLWLVDRPTPLKAVLASLLFALQFLGGRPESSLALLLMVAVAWAVHVLLDDRPAPARKTTQSPFITRGKTLIAALVVLTCIAVGALLAAVQWTPALEYLRDPQWGARCFRGLSNADPIRPYPIAALIEILFPTLGKSAAGAGAWIGTIPLAFAIIGLVFCWKTRRALAWSILAAFAAACLLYLQPLITSRIPRFPGLSPDGAPSALAAVALALAMLAGIGLDELLSPGRRSPDGNQKMPLIPAAVLAAAALLVLLLPLRWRTFWPLIPGAMLAVLAVMLWPRRSPRQTMLFGLTAAVFSAAELLLVAIAANPSTPADNFFQATGAIKSLQDRLGAQSHFRFAADPAILPPILSSGYRLPDLRGSDAFTLPGTTGQAMREVAAIEVSRPVPDSVRLRLLGVRYLLADASKTAPAAPWRQIYPAGATTQPSGSVLYEQPSALPRAWLIPSTTYNTFTPAALSKCDPRTTLLIDPTPLERPNPDAPFPNASRVTSPSSPSGSPALTWLEDSPERIRLSVKGGAGGWLVLADPFAPGWRARLFYTIPGSERKPKHSYDKDTLILPAYGAVRAVPLANAGAIGRAVVPNEVEVVFVFSPAAWRHAWMISAIGLAVLLIIAAASLFPRPPRP